jgi:hypothetical protein
VPQRNAIALNYQGHRSDRSPTHGYTATREKASSTRPRPPLARHIGHWGARHEFAQAGLLEFFQDTLQVVSVCDYSFH